MKTFYVAKGSDDLVRIYRRDEEVPDPQSSFSEDPSSWKEVGTVGERGNLLLISGGPDVISALRSAEPLRPGSFIHC